MAIDDFVFVTFEKAFEVHSTHLVLKEKLDEFINDTYTMFDIDIAHINKPVMYLNGSIVKGDYIKSINICH